MYTHKKHTPRIDHTALDRRVSPSPRASRRSPVARAARLHPTPAPTARPAHLHRATPRRAPHRARAPYHSRAPASARVSPTQRDRDLAHPKGPNPPSRARSPANHPSPVARRTSHVARRTSPSPSPSHLHRSYRASKSAVTPTEPVDDARSIDRSIDRRGETSPRARSTGATRARYIEGIGVSLW